MIIIKKVLKILYKIDFYGIIRLEQGLCILAKIYVKELDDKLWKNRSDAYFPCFLFWPWS